MKAALLARVKLLDEEITANEEENSQMQDEIDGLYVKLDAMLKDKPPAPKKKRGKK